MIEPNREGDSDAKPDPDQPRTAGSGDLIPARQDAPRGETTSPHDAANGSNIMILWPDRSSRAHGRDDDTAASPNLRSSRRRRRMVSMAAVALIAAAFGAAGGAATTVAISHRLTANQPTQDNRAEAETATLRGNLAQLTNDLAALRGDFDRAGRGRTAQIGKIGERLDKVEKIQDEGATKIARLAEAQDKLRAIATGDVTGSIAQKSDARLDGKADPRRLPIVDGWTLTKVTGGGAMVDGPGGLYEAYPGDPLPGLGRVDAVRYQDGRWVVVTSKGLIIRR